MTVGVTPRGDQSFTAGLERSTIVKSGSGRSAEVTAHLRRGIFDIERQEAWGILIEFDRVNPPVGTRQYPRRINKHRFA